MLMNIHNNVELIWWAYTIYHAGQMKYVSYIGIIIKRKLHSILQMIIKWPLRHWPMAYTFTIQLFTLYVCIIILLLNALKMMARILSKDWERKYFDFKNVNSVCDYDIYANRRCRKIWNHWPKKIDIKE